jgi:hypothetical protein
MQMALAPKHMSLNQQGQPSAMDFLSIWIGLQSSHILSTLFEDKRIGGTAGQSILIEEARVRFLIGHQIGHHLLYSIDLETPRVLHIILQKYVRILQRPFLICPRLLYNGMCQMK